MIDRRQFALSAALSAALCLLPPTRSRAAPTGYDPLRTDARARFDVIDDDVLDAARDRRIPVRLFVPAAAAPLPAAAAPAARASPVPAPAAPLPAAPLPVVLFSHGLGGSRAGSAYLGEHWARRGYLAVFLQHPGSDAGVWQDVAPGARREALARAANLRSFADRVRDVGATLDQCARWNAGDGDGGALRGRLDLARIGMSGHSFGGVTTQAVSGQRFARGQRSLADRRIRAAIVMSPSLPRTSAGALPRDAGDAAAAFGSVEIPWLLMTGTRDTAAIGGQTVESRLAVYPALPPGGRYELVLDDAEHSAFTDRALPGDARPRNPHHHRAILATSTAFWDAFLRGDDAARRWLESPAVRTVLDPADRWQYK